MFYKMFAKNCRGKCCVSLSNQDLCLDQLQDTEMLAKLKAMNFDLFLTEYFDPCGLVIGEKLGIKKHIAIYSMPMPQLANAILGLPASLSFVPGKQ